jgi:hypothetical protein
MKKATVLNNSNTGPYGSNPFRGTDIFLRFPVLCLCGVGEGLVRNRSEDLIHKS